MTVDLREETPNVDGLRNVFDEMPQTAYLSCHSLFERGNEILSEKKNKKHGQNREKDFEIVLCELK